MVRGFGVWNVSVFSWDLFQGEQYLRCKWPPEVDPPSAVPVAAGDQTPHCGSPVCSTSCSRANPFHANALDTGTDSTQLTVGQLSPPWHFSV